MNKTEEAEDASFNAPIVFSLRLHLRQQRVLHFPLGFYYKQISQSKRRNGCTLCQEIFAEKKLSMDIELPIRLGEK